MGPKSWNGLLVKVQQYLYKLGGCWGYTKLRLPEFLDNPHMKVVRLSALCTGHLYHPGTHFCSRLSWPQGHTAAVRIMSMNNSNNPTGNRTHDLLVWYSASSTCTTASGEQKFLLPLWELNYSPLVLQPITYHYCDNGNIFIICIEMSVSMHICSITRTVRTTLITLCTIHTFCPVLFPPNIYTKLTDRCITCNSHSAQNWLYIDLFKK